MSDIMWTMEQDYCDNCGAYLYAGGLNDDNSGLCSTCFDLWIDEINDEGFTHEVDPNGNHSPTCDCQWYE